ncbi:MAG TPA: hypothetical protein ENN34_02750 [Deltaproteobacteria bacterium]|nr:hypothetical protein [Deltaproteobacteria bacterium]
MLVVKCPQCGKKIVWDDFQPVAFACPRCGERLNLHTSLKKNIEQREMSQQGTIRLCPHCEGIVSRRWFIRCPHCSYWLFGPVRFHGRWPFIMALVASYIAVTVYYVLYVH